MKKIFVVLLVVFVFILNSCTTLSSKNISAGSKSVVENLKVDYLESPIGLDDKNPLFSWNMNLQGKNVSQSTYRICIGKGMDLTVKKVC